MMIMVVVIRRFFIKIKNLESTKKSVSERVESIKARMFVQLVSHLRNLSRSFFIS